MSTHVYSSPLSTSLRTTIHFPTVAQSKTTLQPSDEISVEGLLMTSITVSMDSLHAGRKEIIDSTTRRLFKKVQSKILHIFLEKELGSS